MGRKEVEFDPRTGEPLSQGFPEDIEAAKAGVKDGIATVVTPNGGKATFPAHLAATPDWRTMEPEGELFDDE